MIKSHLKASDTSADTFPIPKELIISGNEAYAKYAQQLQNLRKQEAEEETARQIEKEKRMLLEKAKMDEQRKSEFRKLSEEESKVIYRTITLKFKISSNIIFLSADGKMQRNGS